MQVGTWRCGLEWKGSDYARLVPTNQPTNQPTIQPTNQASKLVVYEDEKEEDEEESAKMSFKIVENSIWISLVSKNI